MKILCKIGLHKWGRIKQWIRNGKPVLTKRCEKCGKLKGETKWQPMEH